MGFKQFIKERLVSGITELEERKIVAGVLIKCVKTGSVLLLFRNDKRPIWSMVTGGIERGENVLDGLKREVYEELFIRPNQVNIDFKFIRIEYVPEKNVEFHYYQGLTPTEFIPILDKENLNSDWFPKDKLPSPLYKGVAEKIVSF